MASRIALSFVVVSLFALAVASSTALSVVVSFVIGFLFSLGLVFTVFFVGLDTPEKFLEKRRKNYVEKARKDWNIAQVLVL